MRLYPWSVALLFCLWNLQGLQAQILKPAKWQMSLSTTEVTVGDELELIFTATIDDKWYLYSSDFDPNLGPQVTEFSFTPHPSYQLLGGIRPINPQKKYDDIWEGEYTYFKKKGEFRQRVKILAENPKIEGTYSYQVCSDVDGKCIPFESDFSFKNIKAKPAKDTPKEENTKADTKAEEDEALTKDSLAAKQDTASDNMANTATTDSTNAQLAATDTLDPLQANPEQETNVALIYFIGLAFLAGFSALFTPCVFPMIPMTVSIFTKQSGTRAQGITKALVYGGSIVLIYTILGTLVAFFYGAGFNNWLSTHWLPNLFFFSLLVVFALSFLGMFELVLPASWVNQADAQADKGGYYGIFFMAFTLALVSFSCTAPIVGFILVMASKGEVIKPVLGMIAFSTAVALPFTLFALFPSWLNNLPKSGGWLNKVKVSLGLLELALALKFLSQADLVYGWHILPREIFLALWIVIFAVWGFYMLGAIRFPHDSSQAFVPVPQAIMGILILSFVVYLIPGMFGAPLRMLSGYLPPETTQEFNIANTGTAMYAGYTPKTQLPSDRLYVNLFKFPHNLKGFFDYEEGMAYARKVGKPVFIDFTGHGCANCREMEARVWSDPNVMRRLDEDYVLIALYVDDRTKLPEEAWYTSPNDQKVKKTIGAQNIDLQVRKFNNNAQPYYCLLDHNGQLLVRPVGYELNISKFNDFLDEGKAAFKQRMLAKK
ncbi:protein-disulfide reductase DsbD family protein [Eisenibacter elegans]|jgi:thiol:disulfide interchange protein DsbD|uniref:protein-disulfide reductase DsbD family protein n=1 Tax=Eisenibacter elegans TaxID=997 RepID=UPI0004236360|nr:thioredoxin family protein [Eisenibacter elegans]